MADLEKANNQVKPVIEKSSILDEKRQNLLNELSKLMGKTSENYVPILMEELQSRLQVVIQNFNEEFKDLLKISFAKWRIKDSQLRDLLSSNIVGKHQLLKSKPVQEKSQDASTPNFIKDVTFGPLRQK